MWSHYAAKHRGVAFEFASGGDFVGNAFAVNYSDPLASSDPRFHDALQIRSSALLSKAASWAGEGEYRVIGSDCGADGTVHTSDGGFARIPEQELIAVYVGCKMPEPCIRAIKAELQRQRVPVALRRMRQIPGTLRLTHEAVALSE